MSFGRPLLAANPRHFGRGPLRADPAPAVASSRLGDDVKLFASTFVAGFLFVSVLIG